MTRKVDINKAIETFREKCRDKGSILTQKEVNNCEELPSYVYFLNKLGTGWQKDLAADDIEDRRHLRSSSNLNECQRCDNYVLGGLCARQGNGLVSAHSCEEGI